MGVGKGNLVGKSKIKIIVGAGSVPALNLLLIFRGHACRQAGKRGEGGFDFHLSLRPLTL